VHQGVVSELGWDQVADINGVLSDRIVPVHMAGEAADMGQRPGDVLDRDVAAVWVTVVEEGTAVELDAIGKSNGHKIGFHLKRVHIPREIFS
jgi:hypothetical protein